MNNASRRAAEYKLNPEEAFHGPGHPFKDQARLAELERLVGKLCTENEFLKIIGKSGISDPGGEKVISKPERFDMIRKNQCSSNPVPVRSAARDLGVSPSGYYKWLSRKGQNRYKRDKMTK